VTLQCRAGETTFRIHVCDSGVGIRAEELPGLFEPFVQAAYRPGMTDGQGTGLGLSISREFAAGMGGHLLACSEQGRGSIFTLILPMTAGQPSANRP
jgi:signal transduction histidine kinase